jgi:16S rRNA (uracil1498-N3)-methyltransferase
MDRSIFRSNRSLMHLFFRPSLLADEFDLPEEEARHATGVLRLRAGDRIGLLDGKGTRAEAEIINADKRGCSVRVLSRALLAQERDARIHLAVAPTKQMERFEWMLEKCTEVGVDRITPLMTERTERSRLRHYRAERILISAMKQSQRAWLPQLDQITAIEELLASPLPQQRFFGWCEGEHKTLSSTYDVKTDCLMLIGPEGDFTSDEMNSLVAKGFTPVSLGEARLRTETAAIAACTWMNFAQH